MINLLDSEKTLLGQILGKPSIIDELSITSNMFSDFGYHQIFEVVNKIVLNNRPVDLVQLSNELKLSGHSDLLATAASLESYSPSNAFYHVEKLRERLQRVALARTLKEGLAKIKDENTEVHSVVDETIGEITAVMQGIPEVESPTCGSQLPDYLVALQQRIQKRREGVTEDLTFGIASLDRLSGPIRQGEQIIIAARPGGGKTALALQVASHITRNLGKSVAFFSLEMDRNEVFDRLIALNGPVNASQIRSGLLSPPEEESVNEVAFKLGNIPLSVFDGPHTLGLLRSRLRREKAVRGLSLAIVDYLGLLDMGPVGKVARWEKVGEVTRTLKNLALELKIVIILCVQLNREAEGVPPTLGNLRDSGTIEQDADRVILLHCTDKDDGSDEINIKKHINLHLAKNRHGRRGKSSLLFDGDHVRFIS